MSPGPPEARLIAEANEQANEYECLELSGVEEPAAGTGPFAYLNGLWTRAAADFANYRPCWSRGLGGADDEGQEALYLFHQKVRLLCSNHNC